MNKSVNMTPAGWAAVAGMDMRLSPAAIRFATLFAHLQDERPGEAIAINIGYAARKFGVTQSAILKSLSTLVALGYMQAIEENGRTRYLFREPESSFPQNPWEEEPGEAKRNAGRRRALKRRVEKILPGADARETFTIGCELVMRGEATLFDIASLIGAPASRLVDDFERIAGRKATERDFNGAGGF